MTDLRKLVFAIFYKIDYVYKNTNVCESYKDNNNSLFIHDTICSPSDIDI